MESKRSKKFTRGDIKAKVYVKGVDTKKGFSFL
jgi:hypothetical protein